MEKLKLRLEHTGRALKKLAELTNKNEYTEIERDALIQRFEFSYELLWKCGKDYLRVQEGIDAASPRKVIRDCRAVGILSDGEAELALRMVDDRNLTTHTYDEEFAKELAGKIREYADMMNSWYRRMDCGNK